MSVAPGPHRRAGRPRPPARGRRAGQPHAGRPAGAGHRRPRRLAVPLAQQPLARPDPARRRARHGPARPAHRPEGSAGMTRVRGRPAAASSSSWPGLRPDVRRVAPPRAPVPLRRGRDHGRAGRRRRGTDAGRRRRPRIAAEGTYVSTTTVASRLERVAAAGPGRPRPRHHDGAARGRGPLGPAPGRRRRAIVPVDRLTGVGRERGMAGKWVGQNRLVVVTWRADDGAEFATGFLPRSPAQTRRAGRRRRAAPARRHQRDATAARRPSRQHAPRAPPTSDGDQ